MTTMIHGHITDTTSIKLEGRSCASPTGPTHRTTPTPPPQPPAPVQDPHSSNWSSEPSTNSPPTLQPSSAANPNPPSSNPVPGSPPSSSHPPTSLSPSPPAPASTTENASSTPPHPPSHCIFDWSVYTNHLEKANIRGCGILREKQLVVIVFFLRCAMTSACHNVSNNPGFE